MLKRITRYIVFWAFTAPSQVGKYYSSSVGKIWQNKATAGISFRVAPATDAVIISGLPF